MLLDVNTNEVVKFAAKLDAISRSALPVAVRGTLNNAAFDVKQNTMLKTSADKFKNRQPNFFKANSRVQMAKGFNINDMEAIVGFVDTNLKGGKNFSVKNLEQQEHGGTIKNKSFIPMLGARMSGSNDKLVAPANRISGIKNIVNTRNTRGANKRQRFKVAAIVAGVGGFILSENTLFKVKSLNKVTPLYSFKRGRSIQVKPTGFMESASLQSGKKLEKYFEEQAEKQFKKHLS